MRRILPVLALAFPALTVAEELPDDSKDRKRVFELLPEGSQLKGVMIPRYDENRKLIGSLKSKVIRLVNSEEVAGESVSIEFFNEDQTPRGRIDLATAIFNEKKGLLVARDAVDIRSDRLTAHGTALHYSHLQGKGFLSGPGTTTIATNSAQTSMKTPGFPHRATAIAGLALLSATASGAEPPPITEAEVAALHADARTSAPRLAEQTAATKAAVEKTLAEGEAASVAASTFLVQAELPPVAADEIQPATEPLDVKAALGDTVVKFDGGMYFDAEARVLVYRKNVTVSHPSFNVSGANEVKVFFGKKEPAPAGGKDAKDSKDSAFGADIGEVEKIIATGRVVMDEKPKDGKKETDLVHASGAIFSYNLKTDEAIISGGYPWFVRGLQRMRAMEPNLSLRIRDVKTKDPKVNTEGRWEQFFNLEGMNR